MGLLKSLLNMAVKAAADSLTQKLENQSSAAEAPASPRFEPEPQPQREEITDWNAYFEDILKTDFPQYTLSRNVAVTDLAGNAADQFQLYKTRPVQTYKAEWGVPYTFVHNNEAGKPVGVVMLGSGHSHTQNVKYLISRMYAKKLGLPYINFYTQYPNERQYVVGRIRKFLNN